MPQMRHFHQQQGRWPERMVFALAATMRLYKGDVVALADEPQHLEWWQDAWTRLQSGSVTERDVVSTWLAKKNVWGEVLSMHDDLIDAVTKNLSMYQHFGVREALKSIHSGRAVAAA
jgi:tagaturonate reductase